MPTPITEIFDTFGSAAISENSISPFSLFNRFTAGSRSVFPIVNVKSVVSPFSETFCTIISTFIEVSASDPNILPATPGRSFTPRSVIFASSGLYAIPVIVSCSKISSSFNTIVPGMFSKLDLTCNVTLNRMAKATDLVCRTLAP